MDVAMMKIEKIQGAVSFGEIFDFSSRMKGFAKRLQEALYDVTRSITSDAKLDFAIREGEKDSLIVVACHDPDLLLQITKDTMAFRFDDVFDYERVVPKILDVYYNTGIAFFGIDLFLSNGMEFTNIFDFVRGCKNTDLFVERIAPPIKSSPGLLSAFGDISCIYRLDFNSSFKWKEKNLFVKVEAPANEDNTTLWCSLDVRSDKAKVSKDEVMDFSSPYMCYRAEYAEFLSGLLRGWEDKLDQGKRGLLGGSPCPQNT